MRPVSPTIAASAATRDGVLGRYERQGVNSPSLAPLVLLTDTRSEDDALIGSLFNLAYQFTPDHQLSLNTMFNQSGNDMARRQKGLNVSGGGLSETETFETRTVRYTERDLKSFQLTGKHLFPGLRDARLQWSVTDAATSQDEPDTRFLSTFQTPDGSQFFEASGLPRPSRYFRDLTETRDDYSLDFTLPFTAWGGRSAQFKTGGAWARTERRFNERLFEYNSTVLRYDGDEQSFLRDSQVGQVDPATGRFRSGQLYLVETSSLGNSYFGDQQVRAWYGMVDLSLTRSLRLIGGLRRESTVLDVRSRDPRRRAGQLDNDDNLPSASVVLALTDRMNVRAAVTRTIARPNFREIADYTSFEFVGDFVYIGNPNLRRTTIDNYDLRWEWFPRRGEIVAVSFFHKRMIDPIERGVFSVINSGELQYQNAPSGEVRGLELEARKNLKFISERLNRFSGGFNYTWVESSVAITPAELTFIRFFEPGAGATRELTGQSPYIVNLDLTYSNPARGATVSAYYNVFGERLSQVSPPGTPNVYEQPAPTLDLIWNQSFRDHWKVPFRPRTSSIAPPRRPTLTAARTTSAPRVCAESPPPSESPTPTDAPPLCRRPPRSVHNPTQPSSAMIKSRLLQLFAAVAAPAAAFAADVTVNANITANTTWSRANTYILDGRVFVTSGVTLTIEPGTVIKGRARAAQDASALVISRGGRINASGTAADPIVFTAEADNLNGNLGQGDRGLWGGVVILGRARTNTASGTGNIEGIPTTEPLGIYGGTDDADNSGVFRYVSIRHAGSLLGPNNELNGLTMGAVGSGTTIEYVEVFANADDGFEWFGGTVNCKYLVSAFNDDDAFDWDEGFRGKLQFLFTIQDPSVGNHAFESDGGTTPEDGQPYAMPIIYNYTALGSGAQHQFQQHRAHLPRQHRRQGPQLPLPRLPRLRLAHRDRKRPVPGQRPAPRGRRHHDCEQYLRHLRGRHLGGRALPRAERHRRRPGAGLQLHGRPRHRRRAAEPRSTPTPSSWPSSRTRDGKLDPRLRAGSPALQLAATPHRTTVSSLAASYLGAFTTSGNWAYTWTKLGRDGYFDLRRARE
jgi:hypothetical protein